jgi:hypothetical protein
MYVSDTLEVRLSVARAVLLPVRREGLSHVEAHGAYDDELCDALADF